MVSCCEVCRWTLHPTDEVSGKDRYIPTTPPTVLETPETVFPRMPVTVLAAPVTPLFELLFMFSGEKFVLKSCMCVRLCLCNPQIEVVQSDGSKRKSRFRKEMVVDI